MPTSLTPCTAVEDADRVPGISTCVRRGVRRLHGLAVSSICSAKGVMVNPCPSFACLCQTGLDDSCGVGGSVDPAPQRGAARASTTCRTAQIFKWETRRAPSFPKISSVTLMLPVEARKQTSRASIERRL